MAASNRTTSASFGDRSDTCYLFQGFPCTEAGLDQQNGGTDASDGTGRKTGGLGGHL